MKPAGYNEFRTRGRFDFPIEFHHVDCRHPRFHMPYHWHIEYEIVYVLHGGLTLSLNEDTVQARAASRAREQEASSRRRGVVVGRDAPGVSRRTCLPWSMASRAREQATLTAVSKCSGSS